MKRNHILRLWLILSMLIMTDCGNNKNITLGAVQQSEAAVKVTESEVQEPELIPQGNDSETQKTKAEVEKTEPEAQDEPIAIEGSEVHKDASKTQGESEVQEPEPEPQEKATEAEDSQQDAANENPNLPTHGNYYYDVVNVVLYLEVYDELPPNYITKSEAQALGWEGGSVEKYKEGAAIGGDYFGNREGLLPAADGRSYTECDIDTHGYSSRGSRRLVFSNDGLYFYTSNHYESFSEVTVTENYEVIW